jgi:hypothetical protein
MPIQHFHSDSAGSYANSAFLAANNASNAVLVRAVDNFTSAGSSTITLSVTPASKNSTEVFINGVYQNKSEYSLTGTTITFNSAPISGDSIEVITFTGNTTGVYLVTSTYVSSFNGKTGAITLSSANVTTALGYTPATSTDQTASSTYANAAFIQANTATTNAATADSKAVTSGSYANSAFTAVILWIIR